MIINHNKMYHFVIVYNHFSVPIYNIKIIKFYINDLYTIYIFILYFYSINMLNRRRRQFTLAKPANPIVTENSRDHSDSSSDSDCECKKSEFTKTTYPTVNDDAGDGYAVGSRWFNITTDTEYVCLDSTIGAAIWRESISVPIINKYASINAVYSPTVRWIPSGLSGSGNSLVWPASVGSGSIAAKGTHANFVAGSVGGKAAFYCNPSNATDQTKYLRLNLGSTYAGSGNFTFAFVVQDFAVRGASNARFISLLDATPTTGADNIEATNMVAVAQNGLTSGLTSLHNSATVNWSPGTNFANVGANPAVIVCRYTSIGTQWKVWVNNANDFVATTNTINLNSLNIRNIHFGKYNLNTGTQTTTTLRVAEVMFWNSSLSDQNVINLTNDLLIEYGVRPGVVSLAGRTVYHNGTNWRAAFKSEYAKTVAPTVNNDLSAGYEVGSHWFDTTADKAYVCVDATIGAAIWTEITSTGGSSFTDGDGIAINSGTISVDLKANGGLVIESTKLAVDLSATAITGTLSAVKGGTGQSSYTTGDLLYASSSTSLAKLSDIATGNALITGGPGIAPSYGKIGLTTHVAGTLPVGSGGTGTTTLTPNGILLGNGTSGVIALKSEFAQAVAPSPSDDASIGYAVGSQWFDTLADKVYVCVDATLGSAVWTQVSLPSAGSGINISSGVVSVDLKADSGLIIDTNELAVDLGATSISGTLAVSNGGTGVSTLTSNGILLGNGTSAVTALKSEFAQTVAPTVTDDSSAGYTVGSQWYDITNSRVYVCLDATPTAAVWTGIGNILIDNDNDTYIKVELTADDDTIRFALKGIEHYRMLPQDAGKVNSRIEVLNNDNNVFIGESSGLNNTGINNTAIGFETLTSNTSGNSNVAFGYNALKSNTTGAQNVALGNSALESNTSANNNTGIGTFSLKSNTIGSSNVATGYNSLLNNTIGSSNVANGYSALQSNISGIRNVALGHSALFSNSSGSTNTAVGDGSLFTNTSSSNTAIGVDALRLNNSGTGNVASGANALYNNNGNYNVGNGFFALYSNISGNNNVGIGFNAIQKNTTGSNNVSSGKESLFNNTTGSNNVAYGYETLYRNTTSSENTAVGYRALYNTTGSLNCAFGGNAFYNNTSGSRNVSLGYGALNINTTGSNNTGVGSFADLGSNNLNYATAIGASAIVSASNSIVLGRSGTDNVGIGINAPTSRLHVVGSTILNGTVNLPLLPNATVLGTNGSGQIVAGTIPTGNLIVDTDSDTGIFVDLLSPATDDDIIHFKLRNVVQYKMLPKDSGKLNSRLEVINNGDNIFIGENTGNSTTTGYSNTSLGYNALRVNTTGFSNIAIGYEAMQANISGFDNVAIGSGALYRNNASNNFAAGINALRLNTSGSVNLAIGLDSLFNNSTGSNNFGIGRDSLRYNTTGSNNIALGINALQNNNSNSNIAIGNNVLLNNTTGSNNISIGNNSFFDNTTGSNNTGIGVSANVGSSGLSYATAIGSDAIVSSSNSIVLGRSGTDNVGIGINAPTSRLHVVGDVTLQTYNGILVGNGSSALTALKSEFAKTVAPTITDDSSAGYAVGSQWFDITNLDAYVCLNASIGAAVWKKTTP